MMVLIWLPRKMVMFSQRQGVQVEGSGPSSGMCQASSPRAARFDYSFSNDAVRFAAP